MSEKGLLSKSIANNISEAIIDKLGGTGYAPTEWSKNINLLGIASADIEEALASITEEASTSEKGALSLSIASDVGAMLNKKYNTSRGFKPSEVSSAVSMLSPLPEKTASGAIADFSDGADEVPTKSLVVTIPPTLTGVSSVTETQTGRNVRQNVTDYSSVNPVFFQYRNYYAGQATGYPKLEGTFKAGTYTLSFDTSASITASKVGVWAKKKSDQNWYNLSANGDLVTPTSSGYSFCSASSGHVTGTFKVNEECDALGFGYYQYGTSIPYTNLMLEYGSTAHAYEPYTTPTQYTASLGRTIYGGEVDIVNGTGKDGYAKDSMSSAYLSGLSSSYIGYEASTNYFGGHPTIWVRNWNYQTAKIRQAGGIGCVCNEFPVSMHNTDIINTQNRIYFDVNGKGISDVSGFIAFVQNLEANNESLDIVYELETATDFTFDGQEINTRLGYNAFWSDEGDTEVTYRADLDLYEAPSMLLGANNTETEGNEEQEENE